MAQLPAYSTALRNTRLDAITTTAGNAALLRIYDGTRPATGGTATNLLAQLTCASPFAAGAGSGVLTVGTVTQDASADATGTATWARLVTSGGTFVMDMNVGTSGADLNLNSTSITSGGTVSVTSWTITDGTS